MPRYHFDVHDGTDLPDHHGIELPDLAAARREAVRYAAALLGELGDGFWDGGDWQMVVKDARGLVLFTLHFMAINAAATR